MMKKLTIVTAIAMLMGGCYIGRAAFQGEDMKIYPFFGPSATTAESPKQQTSDEILPTGRTSSVN